MGADHPRPRHPRGDGGGAHASRAASRRAPPSPSRCRRRSPSAPAARSAPRARSSSPAARSARCSARSSTSRPASARSCWPAARRPAWPRPSARRSPPSCSRSSCCCSSSRRARSSRSSSPTSVAGGVHAAAVRQRAAVRRARRTSFAGLGQLPLFAAARPRLRPARGAHHARACSPSRPASGGCRSASRWHPIIGAAGLGVARAARAARARRRLRRDRRRARRPAGHRPRWPRSPSASSSSGGSRSASGTSGGTLAPILLISSCFGALRRRAAGARVPGPRHRRRRAFALVAMAATFGAAARAPFAAIVFVFELTRDYDAILPLMLATVLADLVARALLRAQHHDREAGPAGRARARRLPRRPVADLRRCEEVMTRRGRDRAQPTRRRRTSTTCSGSTGHGAYPVVDERRAARRHRRPRRPARRSRTAMRR